MTCRFELFLYNFKLFFKRTKNKYGYLPSTSQDSLRYQRIYHEFGTRLGLELPPGQSVHNQGAWVVALKDQRAHEHKKVTFL